MFCCGNPVAVSWKIKYKFPDFADLPLDKVDFLPIYLTAIKFAGGFRGSLPANLSGLIS